MSTEPAAAHLGMEQPFLTTTEWPEMLQILGLMLQHHPLQEKPHASAEMNIFDNVIYGLLSFSNAILFFILGCNLYIAGKMKFVAHIEKEYEKKYWKSFKIVLLCGGAISLINSVFKAATPKYYEYLGVADVFLYTSPLLLLGFIYKAMASQKE